MDSSQHTTTRSRGRGRGDGSARGRGRGRGQDEDSSFRGQGRGRGEGRGRGDFQDRGRGRGRARGQQFSSPRGHFPRPPYRDPNQDRPVPSFSAISPSTPVSIILKQDQPTGRTVTGIVADLLTRGDHPRGVKVRLRDGRVGRVQALVSQEEGERGERSVGGADADLGRNGEGEFAGRGGRSRGYRQERDIRDEDEYLYDESKQASRGNEGLFGALEAADRKHKAAAGGKMVDEGGYEVVTCPVCMVFKGDERAVQHHVEEHYIDHYK